MATEAPQTGIKTKSQEEIFAEFQTLRNEQRNLANNLSTLESDLKEHLYITSIFFFVTFFFNFALFIYRTVIETLKTVDADRKCFRLIGGVLCERTVKDVLPQLQENKEKFEKLIIVVTEQLSKKGVTINAFVQEHNINVRGNQNAAEESEPKTEQQANRNVLVH